MSQMYAGGCMPTIARTYFFPTVPVHPNDDNNRNQARQDYDIFFGRVQDGGAIAHNAITIQAMRHLHEHVFQIGTAHHSR